MSTTQMEKHYVLVIQDNIVVKPTFHFSTRLVQGCQIPWIPHVPLPSIEKTQEQYKGLIYSNKVGLHIKCYTMQFITNCKCIWQFETLNTHKGFAPPSQSI
jgi:hypothetical protein